MRAAPGCLGSRRGAVHPDGAEHVPAAPIPGVLLHSHVCGGESVQQENKIFLLEVTQLIIGAEHMVSVSKCFSAQP